MTCAAEEKIHMFPCVVGLALHGVAECATPPEEEPTSLADPAVIATLGGKPVCRVVMVPNRVSNVVV